MAGFSESDIRYFLPGARERDLPIRQRLEEAAFDPEAVKVITIAFDKALATLNLVGRVDPLTDIVARKIIDVAESGERDPIRLCELALDQLGR